MFDPRNGILRHSGTFNNNIITMAAGCVGIDIYNEAEVKRLNALGDFSDWASKQSWRSMASTRNHHNHSLHVPRKTSSSPRSLASSPPYARQTVLSTSNLSPPPSPEPIPARKTQKEGCGSQAVEA